MVLSLVECWEWRKMNKLSPNLEYSQVCSKSIYQCIKLRGLNRCNFTVQEGGWMWGCASLVYS